jgi:hypothetical protein
MPSNFWWNPDLFRELRPAVPGVVSRDHADDTHPQAAPLRARTHFFWLFLKGTNAHVGQPEIQSRALPLSADQIEIVLDF